MSLAVEDIFLHAMKQHGQVRVNRQLAGLYGTDLKAVMAKLTCREFLDMIEQLRSPSGESAADTMCSKESSKQIN